MKKSIDRIISVVYIIVSSQKRNFINKGELRLRTRVYDYSKLRGRIKEKIGTEGEFAHSINRTPNYISKVFRNGTYLSQVDIDNGAKVLDIPVEEIGVYFFTQEVHKNETKERGE